MSRTADSRDETKRPFLVIGLNLGTVIDLPPWSKGPRGEWPEILAQVKAAGYTAVQTRDAAGARDAGLAAAALLRLNAPDEAREVAARHRDEGYDSTTLHVGTGFESEAEMHAFAEAILEASLVERHPLFVETHRATITQDMRRTLDLVAEYPDLRFTGDFSHWYTGAEMLVDFDAKLAQLGPVLQRTRLLHGRISSPGCIQVPVADGRSERDVAAFRKFWQASFRGFLDTAGPGDHIGFYPELLWPAISYAREIERPDGQWTEECDRWIEALHLVGIARQCWDEALASA
jgi:hypothetical protein